MNQINSLNPFSIEINVEESHIQFEDGVVIFNLPEKKITTNRLVPIEEKEKEAFDSQEKRIFWISLTLLTSSLSYHALCVIRNLHRVYSLCQIGVNLIVCALFWKRRHLLQEIDRETIEIDKNVNAKITQLTIENKRTNHTSVKRLNNKTKIITIDEENSEKIIKKIKMMTKLGIGLLVPNILLNFDQIYLVQTMINAMILAIFFQRKGMIPKTLDWENQLKDVEINDNNQKDVDPEEEHIYYMEDDPCSHFDQRRQSMSDIEERTEQPTANAQEDYDKSPTQEEGWQSEADESQTNKTGASSYRICYITSGSEA